MRSLTRLPALVAAVTLAVMAPATADAKRPQAAGPPADYTLTRNLSQPR